MSGTGDWKPLGEITIRKCSFYSPMSWNSNVQLGSDMACISKYGGLIAIVVGELQSNKGKRPDIFIYNASGKQISSFRWDSGTLVGIAWSHADELLCIQDDGQILVYNVFCQFQKSFTMGKECKDNKVVEFEVFTSQSGTGIAVMNGLFRFFIVNNIDDPKARMLSDVPGLRSTPPSCWCVLPGPRSSRVLAANNKEFFLLDLGGQCHQQYPSDLTINVTSYIMISVSLDGKHVVLFTNTGEIWMGSSDFQKKYCELNTGDGSRPKQLLWCCESILPETMGSKPTRTESIAVIIYRPGVILVIGPNKDWAKFQLDEVSRQDLTGALLSMDIDGVHVVTREEHSFIQYVPGCMSGIFKTGSMEPGALLYYAEQEYQRESEKADEYLRMLVENRTLDAAVEQCMDAAYSAFQPATQKRLLQAASFGKSFLTGMRLTDMFVGTCRTMRVLNAVRDANVGCALTAAQLNHLTMEILIDRLVQRRLFHLAFQICKYLKTPPDKGASRILAHWACYKVQQKDVPDDEVASAIRNKLRTAAGVSYASIAERAIACDRKDLAVKLLDFESRASEQVRMLSKLGKHRLALEKAVASGNTDLTYSAISSLRERTSLSDFLVAIRRQPSAYKLHLKYCREQNERMLKDLHEQEDHFIDLAHCHIRDSLGTFRAEERVVSLHLALDCFSKARDDFQVKATEEQLTLLREQNELEQELDGNYAELSLHDTIHNLLIANKLKKAEQMRKQYKMSEKRWWWLRITAFAEQRNFVELENFSKSKKSPIGYLPFIEVCIQYSAPDEVAKYISKVAPDKRVAALLKTGNVSKGAELALQTRSLADLDQVLKRCGAEHRAIAEQIRNAMSQLQKR